MCILTLVCTEKMNCQVNIAYFHWRWCIDLCQDGLLANMPRTNGSHCCIASKREKGMGDKFSLKQFIIVAMIASLWVQASEVFRYFVFVMPEFKEFLSALPEVAPMNLSVFSIWGVWDTLLTFCNVFIFWLYAQKFGNNWRSAIAAGTISWLFFFVLFWVGMVNMALAPASLLLITLPLSWIEMVVTSVIASWLYAQNYASLQR
jgi:hypothetical protein